MGSIRDGMCSRCNGEVEDGAGGLCAKCASLPAASELSVAAALLRCGYDVATPARDNAQYDLIFRDKYAGKWHPVQVKTAYNGVVNTCRPTAVGREAYDEKFVEFFAVVDGKDIYLIHLSLVNNGGRTNVERIKDWGSHISEW